MRVGVCMEEVALISVVSILALGIFSQWLAWRIQWPSIFIMSIAGLLIGPLLGLVNPELALGELYSPLISLAVAIILFEGSSNLDVRRLRIFLNLSFELSQWVHFLHGFWGHLLRTSLQDSHGKCHSL